MVDSLILCLDSPMRFKKLVEQHGVHRVVAHGVNFAISIAHHEVGVHLSHLLSYESKLRASRGINVVFVTEGDGFEGRGSLRWLCPWV